MNDVRRQDEFDEGHIPEAICIPNESIIDTQPEELPERRKRIHDWLQEMQTVRI